MKGVRGGERASDAAFRYDVYAATVRSTDQADQDSDRSVLPTCCHYELRLGRPWSQAAPNGSAFNVRGFQ